jgi:hypothetical protein
MSIVSEMRRINREAPMKRISMLIFVFCIIFTSNILAEEYSHKIYKGIRPMGMGGAFVAVSNDANALFYNPAGLADISEKKISILNLGVEFGQGAYDMFDDALDVDLDNEQETVEFLRNYIGDYSHVGLSFFPYYSKPNFAFALIGIGTSNLQARDRQSPKLIIDVVEDVGAATGYARSFFDDNLLVGASVKYVVRRSLDEEYTILDITTGDFKDKLEDDYEDGQGILIDLGLIYKLKGFQVGNKDIDFRVGISANNLIGNDIGDARNIDEHIDLGFAAQIDKWTFALDYVDLFSQIGEDDDITKRIRLGAEYNPKPFLFLRFGFYQGYPTLGIGLETKNVQFDVLTYAEEVGAYSGQRDDRRYALRLGLGF